MGPYLIGAVVGAVLMGRTKPKMALRTFPCFGPRTGVIWTAEVMPGEEVVAIHAPHPDMTIALFQKGPDGRFALLRALRGHASTIRLMQKDLEA